MAILTVTDLVVGFNTPDGEVIAVNGLNFSLQTGEVLGIVGESGSGKSQAMMSLLGLLANNGYCRGQAIYHGQNLITLNTQQMNNIRGNRIAMIFQDPMTSLNPYLRVSTQLIEVLQVHQKLSRKLALTTAIAMLESVQIPDAAQRIHAYPHQLSGGMRQRVMIAMALLCRPDMLIADEPTTALDVTVQAQIMRLLFDLKTEQGMALILITHDLGVVAGICDQVLVMYGGETMEVARSEDLFSHPQHPYTQGLLKSIPRLDQAEKQLYAIPGHPPISPNALPGCPFHTRCELAVHQCHKDRPLLKFVKAGHAKACHLDLII